MAKTDLKCPQNTYYNGFIFNMVSDCILNYPAFIHFAIILSIYNIFDAVQFENVRLDFIPDHLKECDFHRKLGLLTRITHQQMQLWFLWRL